MKNRTSQLLRHVGIKHAHDRFRYHTSFDMRPAVNADIGDTKNKLWEVGGTNMTSALCTFSAGGGVTLTTAGAASDNAYVFPHADTDVSSLLDTTFKPNEQIGFYTRIKTGSSVSSCIYTAGFYDAFNLYDYDLPANSGIRFMYDPDVLGNNNWWVNVIGADDDTYQILDTGILVEADTSYELAVEVDSVMVSRFSIRRNGYGWAHNAIVAKPVNATIGASGLFPHVSVKANEASAKSVTVRSLALGKAES